MSTLAEALFPKTRQRVLALLYGNTNKSFYINEILRSTGMGVATIKRELDRLQEAGILRLIKIGNQHHYQAEPQCPIFPDLKALVIKTLGIVPALANALQPLKGNITVAFVFGSVARGTETANSDIDLMIVGKVRLEEVVDFTHPVEQDLGRPINPRIYTPEEWQRLLQESGSFIRDVLTRPRLDLIGSTDELG